jgi:UDP-N-acetylmuramoylalanine--D-glutamate ligase
VAEFTVEGQRVVVVGAARSGVAAALLLASRGARVTLTDLRREVPQAAELRAAGVSLALGGHSSDMLAASDLVVLSPGVPPHQPAIEAARTAGVPVTGELELAARWVRGRIIAITGTKGKSTTTTLAGRMFEAAGVKTLVGGNLGTPLSAHVDQSTPDTVHVVEASSFQLESIETFHPWIAVLLNFSPDHLDRHADVKEYAAAKARIFVNQTERDWAVINADDPGALAVAREARARKFWFSMSADPGDGVYIERDAITVHEHGVKTPLVPLGSIRLIGPHLIADVAAATAAAHLGGVPADAMVRAVEGFSGLEHALEPVAEFAGVRFVNDSKATNIESARRAIESFDRDLVVILGGRFKGGEWRDLREPLARRGRAVVAIGEARPLVESALADAIEVVPAASMREAVRNGFALANGRGTVLLAPACASFDMFADYADRGRVFKREVAALKEESEKKRA